ncbi:hypothetical protein [Cohnella yongneupensis]|uniref:Uncharacterized protein n=1 Tax=Cohnella yongneupensis TaxID=425006 RepID=A0ABW0QV33_9BACL
MLINIDLGATRKLQLIGIDQTENLKRCFGGSSKIAELAKIDFYKERVLDGAFYLSQKDSEYLVVDMVGGDVHKVSMSQYLFSAMKMVSL